MSGLLENLIELVKMIFATIVQPNYGASDPAYTLLNMLFTPSRVQGTPIREILLLTFGIGLAGVSIGIIKRLLCRN